MNTINEEIEYLLTSLVAFKKYYKTCLTSLDLSLIQLWIQTLQTLEYVPFYNKHFVTCPYSDDSIEPCYTTEILPWSCICRGVYYIQPKFAELKEKYSIEENLQVVLQTVRLDQPM